MIYAKVLRVIDGDSIEVEVEKLSIRLDFIDAPEMKGQERENGIKSKAHLESLLSKGDLVKIDVKKEDTYNRFLSVIYKGKQNINGEMLKHKQAEVYNPLNHNNGVLD